MNFRLRSSARPIQIKEQASNPKEALSPAAAIALIVGLVIGAGIFKVPALVAGMTGSVGWMFGAWVLGGIMSLIGALCYAELATTYPHPGGDYHFLSRAYGKSLSFLFAWARFAVISTGSIALLGFIFGDYLSLLLPVPGVTPAIGSALYAAAMIVMLSLLNLRGIRTGARAQTWLTVLEVAGLLLIVLAAVMAPPQTAPVVTHAAPGVASFGLAMVFVLLTFGGWNEAAYISAELKDRQRNMGRVLLVSLAIISALYLLVIWAYWRGLGMSGMARADAVAASLLYLSFGHAGQAIMAALVMIAAVTSMNATIITGARSSYAAGCDWPMLAHLGQWHGQRGTPANAMRVQCVMALLLVALGALTSDGFRAMVEFTAPVFWLFFLLSGLSLFVLRWRDPAQARPFRVPLYPVTPLLFCAMCVFMLWSSLSYVSSQSLGGFNAAWIGVAVLGAGLLMLWRMRTNVRASARPLSDQPKRRIP